MSWDDRHWVALALWALLLLPWQWKLASLRAPAQQRLLPLLPLAVAALGAALPASWLSAGPWRAWADLGLAIWAAVSAVWLLSLVRRDSSIMDIAYGAVLAGVPLLLWWRDGAPGTTGRWLTLLALVGFGRITLYLAWRNLPHGEDPRYAHWRRQHGAAWPRWSYCAVFALQGVILWLWSLPLVLAFAAPAAPAALLAAAVLLWTLGFVFEAGGDWQLARFRARRRDRAQLLDRGLWALTRHPNYFGQAAMWCGYALLALAHPWGGLALPVAAWITWFMYRGSATSMIEPYLHKTKPGYAAYCARVPAFFPRLWPARRGTP